MQLFEDVIAALFGIGLLVNASLFIPQAIQLWKSKQSRHISLFTFGGFHVIQTLGMLHGYYQGDQFLLWGMAINNVTCGIVTILAVRYRRMRASD